MHYLQIIVCFVHYLILWFVFAVFDKNTVIIWFVLMHYLIRTQIMVCFDALFDKNTIMVCFDALFDKNTNYCLF